MVEHVGSSCKDIKGLSYRIYATLNSNVDTAVVLVHGFRGDQEKTWRQFQRLIDQSDDFDSWDVYFVGYPSTREQIAATAYTLARLIKQIYPRPSSAIFERRIGDGSPA